MTKFNIKRVTYEEINKLDEDDWSLLYCNNVDEYVIKAKQKKQKR